MRAPTIVIGGRAAIIGDGWLRPFLTHFRRWQPLMLFANSWRFSDVGHDVFQPFEAFGRPDSIAVIHGLEGGDSSRQGEPRLLGPGEYMCRRSYRARVIERASSQSDDICRRHLVAGPKLCATSGTCVDIPSSPAGRWQGCWRSIARDAQVAQVHQHVYQEGTPRGVLAV